MSRITAESIEELSRTDYFQRADSPACMAIMPFVKECHVGVEIGVFQGDSSVVFLEHCLFMYFIDPFQMYSDCSHPTVASDERAFRNRIYGRGSFKVIPRISTEAVSEVGLVNFVFVDGNHDLEFVRDDIQCYWPKIIPGGFLSGHDYRFPGVKQAVQEFAEQKKLPVAQHQDCWLIRKSCDSRDCTSSPPAAVPTT